MNKREILIDELKQVPDPLLGEVVDFVRFLKTKLTEEKFNLILASESSLKKEWFLAEEDEAWKSL